jgi:hypothetical protein
MGNLVVTILLFVGVVGLTTLLFGGWVMMAFFRGTWRLIDRGMNRSTGSSSAGRACINPGCRMLNPPHARFCRRCGTDLGHIAGPLVRSDNRELRIDQNRSKIAS